MSEKKIPTSSEYKNSSSLSSICFIHLALICFIFVSGCTVPTEEEELKTRMINASMDMEVYNSMKPELIQGVDLNKAISLGLTYNLELWLSKQELAIQKELKSGAIANMLPKLTADINMGLRDSFSASNSVGLFSGQEAQNVTYSHSDMKQHTYGGVNLLWNVLDFGVSYYRVRQQGSKTLHALHEIRRIKQKLAYDISQAYWQCVTLEIIVERGKAIKAKINSELDSISESQGNGRISASVAIERRYPLKSQLIKLDNYTEMYNTSKLRLAQLMGLPIGAEFSLIYHIDNNPTLDLDVEALETQALNRRPELFQEDLQEAITHDEARATILSMLPSPQLFLNPSGDDNKYLYYNSWLSAGMNVTWNLLEVPNKIFKAKSEYKRMDFIRKKRMALAVAIITQLRIAAIEYDFAITRYTQLKDLASDSAQITINTQEAAKSGKGKKSLVINKEIDALRDFAASMEAYSRVMIAKARISNTIGIDPTDSGTFSTSLPIRSSIDSPTNQNMVYITDSTSPVVTEKAIIFEPTSREATKEEGIQFIDEQSPIILDQYSTQPKPIY